MKLIVKQAHNNEAAKFTQDNTVKLVIQTGGNVSRRSTANWNIRIEKAAWRMSGR